LIIPIFFNVLAHLQNRYAETETFLFISNFPTELDLKQSGFVKCSQLILLKGFHFRQKFGIL